MLTNEQKEHLIAQALETEEGRIALSNAMFTGTRFPYGAGRKVDKEKQAFSVKVGEENE